MLTVYKVTRVCTACKTLQGVTKLLQRTGKLQEMDCPTVGKDPDMVRLCTL